MLFKTAVRGNSGPRTELGTRSTNNVVKQRRQGTARLVRLELKSPTAFYTHRLRLRLGCRLVVVFIARNAFN